MRVPQRSLKLRGSLPRTAGAAELLRAKNRRRPQAACLKSFRLRSLVTQASHFFMPARFSGM